MSVNPVPPDLEIFYPNGRVEAGLTYIWDGSKPIAWDGTVTVGSVTSSGVIADGVNNAILATVKDLTNSNPLTVAVVDTTGAQIASFGGGTQYVDGTTNATPTGNIVLWLDTANVVRAVSASKPLPVSAASVVTALGTPFQAGGSIGNTAFTANAGTNLNTSALALEAGGNLAAAAASLSVLDDWDESDRAKVNPIAGQAGVAGGSGVVGATTQRVVLATDVALPTGTNTLGAVNILQNKTIKVVTGSTTADTDIIAAVSSKRLKVFAYSFFTFGTSASTVLFKSNGTGGTEVWRICLQSVASQVMGANLATSVPSFLFATVAGEKLTMDVGNTDTINYSISYWDDDAS